MKSVFIAFDQAHKDAVISLLEHNNCRGFSFFEQMQGRGSKTGEPHYGTHAWPSMNTSILAIVEDEKIPPLLDAVREIDSTTKQQGSRAFVWDITQMM